MKSISLLRWMLWLALPALATWSYATTTVAPTFGRLVETADFIVRAKVLSVTAEWRDNPTQPGKRYIGSRVELEVAEVIKGSPPSPLILDLVGGRLDGQELAVEGSPRFEVGQETIVFVQGNGRQIVPLVGMKHGKYDVRKNRKTGREEVLRGDGEPLFDEQQVALPTAVAKAATQSSTTAQPLSPAEFAVRIRHHIKSLPREGLK